MLKMSQSQQSNHSANNANMFRVGDYCFFETQSGSSYAIRRIEELNRTSNGNVEARVMCFYRRSEIPPSILSQVSQLLQNVEYQKYYVVDCCKLLNCSKGTSESGKVTCTNYEVFSEWVQIFANSSTTLKSPSPG